MSKKHVYPRKVPDRDSRYMGLAWFHAGFSKDPSTQVGAQIVSQFNKPLGSGYNGPPSSINDESFSWSRPPEANPDEFSKYDVMIHAECNAIDFSKPSDLTQATLYVTAFPCKACMLEIAKNKIGRVVYMDWRSDKGSILQRSNNRSSSEKIAELANIRLEEFTGNIAWVRDWTEKMKALGLFEPND